MVFSLEGFQTVVRENITLALEQTLNLKIEMKLGNLTEAITITGQVAQIDVKSTAKGMTLTKEVFQTLPKGRELRLPGHRHPGRHQMNRCSGGISVDGASGLRTCTTSTAPTPPTCAAAPAAQSVAFDFVDEVQVKASGYQAEFGGSLGGVINVVTRSGGNEFHGEVIGYYSGCALRSKERDIAAAEPERHRPSARYFNYDDVYGVKDDSTLRRRLQPRRLPHQGQALVLRLRSFPTTSPAPAPPPIPAAKSSHWKRTRKTPDELLAQADRPAHQEPAPGRRFVNNFQKYEGDQSNIRRQPAIPTSPTTNSASPTPTCRAMSAPT